MVKANSKKEIKERIEYLEQEQKKEHNEYRELNLKKLKEKLQNEM